MALIQIEKGIVEQPDINISEALKLYDEKIKNIFIKLLYSSAIVIPFLTIIVIFNLNI